LFDQTNAQDASRKDDLVDDNQDGVADVKQITRHQVSSTLQAHTMQAHVIVACVC
jgi:hypothetical protein